MTPNPQLRKELEKVMKDMHATTHMPDCAEHCDGDERFLYELEVLVALQADKAVQDALLAVRHEIEKTPIEMSWGRTFQYLDKKLAELKGGSDE